MLPHTGVFFTYMTKNGPIENTQRRSIMGKTRLRGGI